MKRKDYLRRKMNNNNQYLELNNLMFLNHYLNIRRDRNIIN
jgi:hypothetical protein